MPEPPPTSAQATVTVEASKALTAATLRASADVGRRIPQSVVINAALRVAGGHPEEFARALE